jgi:hypothetical protein
MKEAKSAVDTLIDFIKALTPAQADKLANHFMPLLNRVKGLSINELVFLDVFTKDIFSGAVANEKSL